MSKLSVIFGILILQLYVNAAPSDISKLEDIANTEEAEPKLDDVPIKLNENENNGTSDPIVRQKRFYNFYGYGFPPINPVVYPSYGKRDDSSDTGVYGSNDPFDQIHRRLQEIFSIVRQPRPPPPPPSYIPIFFPVIYIPQVCSCNPSSNNDKPTEETPTATETNQTSNPNVTQRLPDLDDEDYETEFEDNSRPISFDPIVINTTLLKPPPPVEHGSSQAGAPNDIPSTSTSVPTESPATKPPILSNDINIADTSSVSQVPSLCDGAILSCCHQLYVTDDCFARQGCPEVKNPCEVNIMLAVIYKFQNYYAQQKG